MENFEELLQKELDKLPYTKHLDDGRYNDGQKAGFEIGARWAFDMCNKWVNVNDAMPDRHKYVLIHTPYCKYKCAVGFWNGVEWKSADNNDLILNVELWQDLPILED